MAGKKNFRKSAWNVVFHVRGVNLKCQTCFASRLFPSSLPPPPLRNHSNENAPSPLQVHFQSNQIHFHMKGFARRLVSKTRHKVIG